MASFGLLLLLLMMLGNILKFPSFIVLFVCHSIALLQLLAACKRLVRRQLSKFDGSSKLLGRLKLVFCLAMESNCFQLLDTKLGI